MAVKRPSKDPSTRVAEGFSRVLTRVQKKIKAKNSIGFGQEEIDANEYKKRLLGMSKAERMAEIDSRGIEAVTEALRN
jgi:hypothetical protein